MRVSSLDGRNSTFLHHKGIDFIRELSTNYSWTFPRQCKTSWSRTEGNAYQGFIV